MNSYSWSFRLCSVCGVAIGIFLSSQCTSGLTGVPFSIGWVSQLVTCFYAYPDEANIIGKHNTLKNYSDNDPAPTGCYGHCALVSSIYSVFFVDCIFVNIRLRSKGVNFLTYYTWFHRAQIK